MIKLPSHIKEEISLIRVKAMDPFHEIMCESFINVLKKKIPENKINTIEFDLDCIYENIFKNPKRLFYSLTKIILRLIRSIVFNSSKFTLSSNLFFLRFRDLKDILRLVLSSEISNQYTYQDIQIGDLINDTIQRYTYSDFSFLKPISRAFIIIQSFIIFRQTKFILKKSLNKYPIYLAAYGSYSHAGIPFRIFCKSEKFTCYSSSNLNHCWYRFNTKSSFPWIDYVYYGDLIQKGDLYPIDDILQIAEKAMKKRINGLKDITLPYMEKSSFNKVTPTSDEFDLDDSTIIYLHDFIDNSHVYPGFIFENIIDWFRETLETLIDNKIKFYIKEHPNETIASKNLRLKLFKNIDQSIYLPKNISNDFILSSNLNRIVSAHGNIIIEAGFYGHYSIGATTGAPVSTFKNLVKIGENRSNYRELLTKKFTKPNKKTIEYEAKLAFFLVHKSDYFLKDKNLKKMRELWIKVRSSQRNKTPLPNPPEFEFL